MYYFLSGTTNPTRYSLLIYNYNTPAQFHEVIRVLDQHKVRYVVWNTNFETKAAPYFSAAMYTGPLAVCCWSLILNRTIELCRMSMASASWSERRKTMQISDRNPVSFTMIVRGL